MRNLLKKFEIENTLYAFDGHTLELFIVENEDEYNLYASGDNEDIAISWPQSFISKVVLNISNACNLRCKYCYADGGNYGRCEAVMSMETLSNIVVELKAKHIDKIGVLSLFGGEPLLNTPVIVGAIDMFSRDFLIDNIELVTNGTLLTNEIAKYLLSHNVRLVISCDGPQNITDKLRGKGTFEKAMSSLEKCKEMEYPSLFVSATYTKMHEDMGYSYQDICAYFENLGYEASVSTVLTSDEQLRVKKQMSQLEFTKDVQYSLSHILHNNVNGAINPYVHATCLSLFCKTRSTHFCDDLLASRSLCYDYNGDKYNCFRLWNDSEFCINDEETSNHLQSVNCKDTVECCRDCWARNMCKTCIVAVLQNAISFPVKDGICADQTAYGIVMSEIIKLVNSGFGEQLANNYVNNFLVYK